MSTEQIKPGYKRTEVGVIPEDWVYTPLYNFLSFISYGFTNPMPTVPDGIFMITAADITGGRLQLETARKTSESAYRTLLSSKSKPRQNDILLTKDGTLGRLALTGNETICINQSVAVMRPNERIIPQFLKILLESPYYQKRMVDEAGGSTIKHIYITIVDKMPLGIPLNKSEQSAIAAALSDVDALLAHLDQLIAKKRDIKQAAMQQLLTGQTRLPGFSGDWEVKRLGDFSRFLRNGTFSRAELEEQGGTHYLHYGDIHTSSSARLDAIAASTPYLSESKARTLDRLECGDLVFADASEDYNGVGKSVEISNIGSGLVSGLHTIPIRFQKSILSDGFKAYLQFIPSFRNHLLRLASGTKVYATQRSHIASAELKLPPVEEQTAIATVLSDMDAELAALEARRDKTRALKQGLMQELLTGRIRLV